MANNLPTTPSNDPAHLKAVELAHQTCLSAFSARRQEVIEWTRLQWLISTAVLTAGVAAFAFLTPRRSADHTVFLLLPFVFVTLEVSIMQLQRMKTHVAARISQLGVEMDRLIRSLDGSVQPTLEGVHVEVAVISWTETLPLRVLAPLFQPAIWIAASVASMILFLDREGDPTPIQLLLLALGAVAVVVLIRLAYIFHAESY